MRVTSSPPISTPPPPTTAQPPNDPSNGQARIYTNPNTGKTHVFVGDGDDRINVHFNADGSATVNVNGEVHELTAEQASNLVVRGASGSDTITVTSDPALQSVPGVTLRGGHGHDIIVGGSGSDRIHGGRGDDSLDGGGGPGDEVWGGRGHDDFNNTDGDTVHRGLRDANVSPVIGA
jgi:Ca2+-binding RTX toxin-like protein